MIFHSRARAEKDWDCQRMRFYSYDFSDGIVKDNLTLDLFIGSCLHDALAAIATHHQLNGKVDIDSIASASGKLVLDTLRDYTDQPAAGSVEATVALEQSTLVEGLVRGFYKHVWPVLIAHYPEVVGIEQETIFPHDEHGRFSITGPFVYCAKPDLILRGEPGLVYFEWKSTGTKKLEWVESWKTAVQVHGTAKAIEFTYNEPPYASVVQGLYKGSNSYGKFSSPFVFAYEMKGNPPFSTTIVSSEWKKGSKRVPVWELEGGSAKFIDKLPPDVLSEQFLQTPLIFTNEDMAETFFRQRAIREMEVSQVVPLIKDPAVPPATLRLHLDKTFPQSFDSCRPAWGSPCDYFRLCHSNMSESPLDHGYTPKDRTHETAYREMAQKLLSV